MLQGKDIKNLGELKKQLKLKDKAVDSMVNLISLFDFKRVIRRLNQTKQKGYSGGSLLSILMILPFIGQASIYALLKSGYSHLSEAQKDSYYRLKNNSLIDWRHILWLFVKRYLKLIEDRTGTQSCGLSCMIIDDTMIEKKGEKIEKISRVWDHVTHRALLGFKLLCLGWYDGKSFVPLDFSLHREKGKRSQKPYGLTKMQHRIQYKKDRADNSPAMKRIKEMDEKKTDTALSMIKRGVSKGFIPRYVLMDSWFSCEKLIGGIRKIKKHCIHIVAMMKMGGAKYTVGDKQYTARQLLNKHKKNKKRCRRLNATYIEVPVIYKGIEMKLFFCRLGKRGDWHLIGTTDSGLTFIKAMEIYQIRWTIEVFYKEAKQYLNLGRCQSNDLDAHFADMTITMMQYTLLSLKKRFMDYETKGELFRKTSEQMLEITLQQRLWLLFIEIVTTIAKIAKVDVEELMKSIFNDNDSYLTIKRLMRLDEESVLEAA